MIDLLLTENLILLQHLDLLQDLGPHGLNLKCECEELLLGQLVLDQFLFCDDVALPNVLIQRPPGSGVRFWFDV